MSLYVALPGVVESPAAAKATFVTLVIATLEFTVLRLHVNVVPDVLLSDAHRSVQLCPAVRDHTHLVVTSGSAAANDGTTIANSVTTKMPAGDLDIMLLNGVKTTRDGACGIQSA
jgi:hypothetical protein